MKQFEAFDPAVRVLAYGVEALVDAVSVNYKTKVENILRQQGITPKVARAHIPWQQELDVYRQVSELLGNATLRRMGLSIAKKIPVAMEFPDLETALKNLNEIYKTTHTGGNVGYYRLTKYDEENGEAEMVCFNPYPGHFDQGLILGFVDRFKSKDAMRSAIEPISGGPCREEDGGAKSTYRITWETFAIRQRRLKGK
ncbi:MAG: hypothetical protein AAFQ98_15945 [Bacteroidota bacterium]